MLLNNISQRQLIITILYVLLNVSPTLQKKPRTLGDILTDKTRALSFLTRHKRETGEQHREAEEACSEDETFLGGSGCFIEEMYEIYGHNKKEKSRQFMIDFKCNDKHPECKEGCINTNTNFYEIKKLKLRCIVTCSKNADKCDAVTEDCVDVDLDIRCDCKDGYRREGGTCRAICNGKTDYSTGGKACSIYYSENYQKAKDGYYQWSGGTCSSPDNCVNCDRHGFYSVGPRCEICNGIDNCNYWQCTTSIDQICQWCDGDVSGRQYWRAYTSHLDNTKCQKACSWRANSSRCYPGNCTDELASKCVCAPNFSGHHCETIDDHPAIEENFCKFSDDGGSYIAENDGNYAGDNYPVIWTNFPGFRIVYVNITAKYQQPSDSSRSTHHYVTDFRVGLIEVGATLTFYQGSTEIHSAYQTCRGLNEDLPQTHKQCQFNFNYLPTLKDDTKVIFKASSKNGGYVKVQDREHSKNDPKNYLYNGKTTTREFEFHWDLYAPYHCSVSMGTSCQTFIDIVSDITQNPNIEFTWDGWTDDLSQISHYSFQVFELMKQHHTLADGIRLKPTLGNSNVPVSNSSASVTLTEPSVYSIHLMAHDKAGNYQTARGLLFFDDASEVEVKGDNKFKCTIATETEYGDWVIQDTNTVKVIWTDRFINNRHVDNAWLSKVDTYSPGFVSIYEDLYGNRTEKAIKNVHGIVDFQVSFQVHSSQSTLKDSRPLTSISEIDDQFDILTLNWDDGDRWTVTVKAFDIFRKSAESSITLYRDATPPVIKNVWLTKGDRLNVSVHNIQDFTKMMIEWEAFDLHSGLHSVYWKLYDSYSDSDIVHGYEDIVAQGHAANLSSCNDKYDSYPRGANCYCTLFMGCFHRHFQVKPEIKSEGGLILNKDQGDHEYDYFIDISVTSKANLTTKFTRKITIDITPPHTGIVNDGLKGNPEIDYQQGMVLHAYWEQFFDRESGVYFYQYIVGKSCADKNDLSLNLKANQNVVETYNKYGSHTATTDGTYYFTVVAYNRALDPSDPVCSDGVTIDRSVPGVKEVVVKDSLITGGLITDSTKSSYYILGLDRVRRLISTPTADCVHKATVINDIDLYPLMTYENETAVEVEGTIFCPNSSGSPSNVGLTLFKSSLMELSWEPIDIPAKVYDYEVGLSSTPGSGAPDIMSFQSSKQHTHFRISHGNIPDATLFYIIIKTMSKSNVVGLTTLGPCFVDTTPPMFSGTITVLLSGEYLKAEWESDAFIDSEELFSLNYQFAIGHTAYGTEIQNFKELNFGGTCNEVSPPTCTVVKVTDLDWFLHGHHTYYVSIKVTNTAGLVSIQTSSPYIHDVQLPDEGVVLDINTENFQTDIPLLDTEDTDFQTNTTSLAVRWTGFAHPHLNVTYKISVGTSKGAGNIISMKDVGNQLSHKETGLSLVPYQKYFVTVTAVSLAGNTGVSSDGVTIVTENDVLSGVMIYDGQPCIISDLTLDHHEQDNRMHCSNDTDFQMSTNSLKAYWTVPEDKKPYSTDAWIAIQRRSETGSLWSNFRDFVHMSTVYDISIDDLILSSGIMYRVVLKLCARTICFQSINSNGVMVIGHQPVTGRISVEHQNTTVTGGAEKLIVSYDRFFDPDIEDMTEKYDVVDNYEFTITDDSTHGKIYIPWTSIGTYTEVQNKILFEYSLHGEMDFSKCKRLSVRGYNKVKQYSMVSTDIRDCQAINPSLIEPNVIIDAVGLPGELDGIGKTVYLDLNAKWKKPDEDYTPYKNVLSAVWPSLRHRKYKYAILDAKSVDVTTYYRQTNQLVLRDPWSHPNSIRNGSTHNEFMNEGFEGNEALINGKRYIVCVHADARTFQRENWVEFIEEVNVCSDGIVVDLTPPAAGRVWIGHRHDTFYQTRSTGLYVTWDGFHDIEEYNTGRHSTGIKEYWLAIGTTAGGNDVHPFENVGVVQYKALHGLSLQNGFQYYATIRAVDFANRMTTKVSLAITVDMTPPDRSNAPITIVGRHIVSTSGIEACWKNVFTDLESGIDYYLWSVGSEPGYTDKMSYVKVIDNECSVSDYNNPLDLLDGHYYYINVRAFNKAGLSSLATSWAFQVDTTPPTAGHVYDGDVSMVTGGLKDIDYQTNTKDLHACWEGFHDSHSTIRDYYVAVGTCAICDDVLIEQAIGITNDFTLSNVHLGVGVRYYVTVTACNTADMCTSVTSDGVIIDNSAPTAGRVQDGVGFYDTEYQSMTSYISAKWYGFDDPQSGLEKYVWRAGTTKGGNDIVAETELHLTETTAKYSTSLRLSVNKRIYVTVRAYNKAGLWSESTSNGFIVDTSPPTMYTMPTFSVDLGIMGLTQIYRSTMKIEWNVDDAESFIKRQFLSIKSHIGGEFMLSSISINGIARSYVFTGLDLHDGVEYYVTLISCNGADICTTSTSQGMFVDSTPPSRGMFAIKTDHVSDPDLSRHNTGWMTWSRHAVNLAWLGFSDVHSGIDHYRITVGSEYMADDLNKEKNKKYFHTTTNRDHGEEGYVQLYTVPTSSLSTGMILFITVWAVNGVGVRSHMIHSAFTLEPGYYLSLVRRCEAFSCDGHCVCAPQDQKCSYSTKIGNCIDKTANNINTLLLVRDTNGHSTQDLSFTSSDTVLRGMWMRSQVQGLTPKWYEWSVGYSYSNTPIGIYNMADDKVWQDAGQLTDATFSSTLGVHLHNAVAYALFVRVWYSSNQYAIFKSNGITIMGKAPTLTSVRGRMVTERVQSASNRDDDFMQVGRPINFDWHGRFLEASEVVKHYDIYLSTFPGGQDIRSIFKGLSGTTTAYNSTRMTLTSGVVYYSNVIAYNYAGAHTTSSSDGFMADINPPSIGMVYDGIGIRDMDYTNTSDAVTAHWHGFIDTESGIQTYHWCVGITTHAHLLTEKTECNIMPWINVGLHVSVSRNISSQILQGTTIYNKVYATDNVGLKSKIVVSDGMKVDKTPPVPEKLVHTADNIVENPSFENTGGNQLDWSNFNSTNICMLSSSCHPLSWQPASTTCMSVISSNINLARDGRSFLYIRGSIHQQLGKTLAGRLYKISFFSSHIPNQISVSANKEGFIQLGDQRNVFLIYTKNYRLDYKDDGNEGRLSWHAHTFYFKVTVDNVNVTIGSMDKTTGIFFDNIRVQEVSLNTGNVSGHVTGHVVYLHEWSSIHGSWSVMDPESPIVDYTWAIGYDEGGTQIQPFRSAGRMNFGLNNNVTLVHNTSIYITVIATNAAGLRGVSYSDPILVDLTPPDIKYVYDGKAADETASADNLVVANWAVEDLESDIKVCQWAIGYKPSGNDLLLFTVVTTMTASMEFPYNVLLSHTIYTTLMCENNAGLTSVKSSNGLKISNQRPSATNAQAELVSIPATEFKPRDSYQGITNGLRLKCSGFTDDIGIRAYMLTYTGKDEPEQITFPPAQDVLFLDFKKMSLSQQNYNVSVQARNVLDERSDALVSMATIDTTVPNVDSSKSLSITWTNNIVEVSWDTIFSSARPLFYEVSAGSVQAGVNIIQWQETNATSITFSIPPAVGSTTKLPVHVTVTSVSVSGFSSVKTGSFVLP